MAEHRGLGFDAADSPREHAEAVGHRGVRIGSDDRVGIRDAAAVIGGTDTRSARTEYDPPEKLDVDLMDDARIGRYGTEVVERVLAPLQERIALVVAIEFELRILCERCFGTEAIDLDRVVDHEFDRLQRIDLPRIAAHVCHRVAHRGEIDDAGHTREILEQDARRAIGDFTRDAGARRPSREGHDVVGGNAAPVLETNEIFKQNL